MLHFNQPVSNVTHRGHRQCQRELRQIQRGLLRQYGNQLHEADQPAEPGDQGEGESLTRMLTANCPG